MARTKYRGFNIQVDPNTPTDTIRRVNAAADWGANVLRIQINDDVSLLPDMEHPGEYEDWLSSKLAAIAVAAQAAEQRGVGIIISQHQPFGGSYLDFLGRPRLRLFKIDTYKQAFIEDWSRIAWEFKDTPAVIGYDLLNEPPTRRAKKYVPLMLDTARSIRVIDKRRPIIISTPYGDISKFKAMKKFMFRIKRMRRIWLTAHMYWPHSITHQGVPLAGCKIKHPIGPRYPRMNLNAGHLREHLYQIYRFKKIHRIPIFIGEFSCIRWSGYPDCANAYNYLNDLLPIMRSFGLHWAYHAFEEAGMWRLDFTNQPCPDPCNPHCQEAPDINTDRAQLMINHLKGE